MSLGKVIRAILIGLVSFPLLIVAIMAIVVAGTFFDFFPLDPIFHLKNGYAIFDDPGGDATAIVYDGDDPRGIGIGARVDDFQVDGDKLLVARRPTKDYIREEDGALMTDLLPKCEYWVINVKTHEITQTSAIEGLRCYWSSRQYNNILPSP